jgi:iron complex transport system substrate-binding protein
MRSLSAREGVSAPARGPRRAGTPSRARPLAAAVLLLVAAGPAAAQPAGAPWPDSNQGIAAGGLRWLGPPAPSSPRRVVSLAPSVTDTMVALGLADRLVGVTRFDTAPEVARVARVGGFVDPSVEAVVALRPDLVVWLTDGSALAPVRRIAELGIPVMAVPIIGVEDVLAATHAIAAALGDPAAGDRLAARISAAVDRARARAAPLPRRRVLLVVGREPLVVAGPRSYADQLLAIVGATNVVTGTTAWPVFPVERAAALDPDVVIDAAAREHGAGQGGLDAIPAVRRGALRRLATDDALRPGPAIVRTLDELFAAIHPEAARAPPAAPAPAEPGPRPDQRRRPPSPRGRWGRWPLRRRSPPAGARPRRAPSGRRRRSRRARGARGRR